MSSDSQSKSLGFGAFSTTSSSGSSSGFSFKPSALAPLTTHINTKVISNTPADLPENSHTPAVLKFLSSKPEDLLNDSGKTAAPGGSSNSAVFVFGKNIDARVVNVPDSPPHCSHDSSQSQELKKDQLVSESEKSPLPPEKSSVGNGSAVTSADKLPGKEAMPEEGSDFLAVSRGLIKPTTAEPEESTSAEKSVFHNPDNLNVFNVNRLPPPVASLETGEENEDTLFHATCKLHIFDSQKNSWHERGRGLVKINRDRTTQKCRIVMRQQGIFRLLLNSPIFTGMRLKQVSARGIHVTATEVETGGMRVFLLTSTTPTEALHLYHYLARIVADLNALEAEEKAHLNDSADGTHEEWKAAAGARASKHGRQSGSDSIRNSQEDISTVSSQVRCAEEQHPSRRGSSVNYIQQSRGDSDDNEEDDEGEDEHNCKAKRALTVLPNHKSSSLQREDSNSANSRGSCSVDSNGLSSSSSEPESLDDSLSSHSAGHKDPSSEYSAETSNASLDLKRPRLLTTNVDGVQSVVDEEEGAEADVPGK